MSAHFCFDVEVSDILMEFKRDIDSSCITCQLVASFYTCCFK